MEAEQAALADQALVEFAASYGLEMPPADGGRGGPAARRRRPRRWGRRRQD